MKREKNKEIDALRRAFNAAKEERAAGHYCYCGTGLILQLSEAVERFHNGEILDERFIADEVEMTVLDDWAVVGTMWTDGEGKADIVAPLISVEGKTERLFGDDEIAGFKPLRGHEYHLLARRIFLVKYPDYRVFELIKQISDRPLK